MQRTVLGKIAELTEAGQFETEPYDGMVVQSEDSYPQDMRP
jgi:hypothetical protein